MNRFRLKTCVLGLIVLTCALQSCVDDDDDSMAQRRPTALVTVRPTDGGAFTLQLDNTTTLYPSNMKSSPFGNKEVRALVNYTDDGNGGKVRNVYINWMDSIRTKMPVPNLGTENDARYGNDAIEIVKDWVTVAEDGYLTLRIRTQWGRVNNKHYVNLLTGINPDNPYELELRHDAKGDIGGSMGDALIAFNLNDLPPKDKQNVKLKLNWKSFSGKKSAEFDLYLRPQKQRDYTENINHIRWVE